MANSDLTGLTETTTPASTDLGYTVTDPSGAKNPRKSTWANILKIYDALTATFTNKLISLTTNTLSGTAAEFDAACSDDNFVFTSDGAVISGGALGTPSSGTLTNCSGLPESGVTNLTSDLGLKAPLASPTFTGTVTSPRTLMTGRHVELKGADVASASTLTLGTDGNYFVITGTTTINYITTSNWQAGAEITLEFSGALTLAHNTGSVPGSTAALYCPNAINFVTTANTVCKFVYNGTYWVMVTRKFGGVQYGNQECLIIAVGDETTAITTGTAKVTFRMPYPFTITKVKASLTTASSSGTPTVDINEGGSTIMTTNKLVIDANELTTATAATAATVTDSALADDAEITIDIDTAGTGAKGLKVYIIGYATSTPA